MIEENQLIEQYQQGIDREKILEYFYKQYDKCLWLFANKYYGYGKSVEDAHQDNFLKLMDCLEKFDVTTDYKFITYLYKALENEFKLYLRNKNDDFYKRHKLMFSYDSSFKKESGDESDINIYYEGTTDTYFFEGEIDERMFNSLSDKEKEIVDMLVQGKNQYEIAKELGYSQAGISKIINHIRSVIKFNMDKLDNGLTPPDFTSFIEDEEIEEEIDEKYLEVTRRNSKYYERIGESIINSNGFRMTIVEYKSAKDIDVMFDDGTIIKHTNYLSFQRRNIAKPGFKKINNENQIKQKQIYLDKQRQSRIGMKNVNNQGYDMVIVEYINSNHIYVQFDDGTIKKCSFSNFMKGRAVKPGTKGSRKRKSKGEE